MSIDTNVAVMSAKLKGDTQTLQQMAAQGDMSAFLALKEILDRQQARKAAGDVVTENTPEQPSVLSQVSQAVAQEAPPAGLAAAYAEGGPVKDIPTDGYNTIPAEDAGLSYWEQMKRLAGAPFGILGAAGRELAREADIPGFMRRRTPGEQYKRGEGAERSADTPQAPGRTYDTGSQEYTSPTPDGAPAAVAAPVRSGGTKPGKLPPGIAGVAGPEPTPTPAVAVPEAAKPRADYDAFLKEMQGLSAEEKAARIKKMEAEKANFEQTETRLKGKPYDKLFSLFEHMSQQRTSNPLSALGGASAAFQKEQRDREKELETLQTLRRTQEAAANLANIAAAKGDIVAMHEHAGKADEAKRKADELAGKLKLEAAQTAHAQAQADNTAKDAESRRIAANAAMKGAEAREAKIGAAGGAKPWSEKDKAIWLQKDKANLLAQAKAAMLANPMMTMPTDDALMRQAQKNLDRVIAAQAGGAPTIPDTAAPAAGEWGMRKLQ